MMKPPWIEFPEYERGCMGWRMGGGEDYFDDFKKYIINMPKPEFAQYALKYPEPKEWLGFMAWLSNS